MRYFINLYSNQKGEIKNFLNNFFINNSISNIQNNIDDKNTLIEDNTLEYKLNYDNPIEMSDLIGAFIDNKDSYKINMWLCIDEDVLINVTQNNADEIIRYLYERFPY